jgi:uncharacterized repeat protein (TIGR01451 family)
MPRRDSQLTLSILLTVFVGCWACPPAARASEQSERSSQKPTGTTRGVQVETLAERRVVVGGAEGSTAHFVSADQLSIGDEIFYTLRVRNTTDAALEDVIVTKPIPRNTRYVPESAVGPGAVVSVSIDGGATFADPDDVGADESPIASNATTHGISSDSYTHIRWKLRHPLAPGAIALLRFRGVFK